MNGFVPIWMEKCPKPIRNHSEPEWFQMVFAKWNFILGADPVIYLPSELTRTLWSVHPVIYLVVSYSVSANYNYIG